MSDRLGIYRGKRRTGRTPEPFDDSTADTDGRRFVIQHHDASSDHYDFRLEHDGVLLSWAVPKGPSTDPRDKRLAIRTEDHPLGYADFEGVIPEGEYGAGPVIVWDAGSWEPAADDADDTQETRRRRVSKALDAGHLRFRLDGHKLAGGYVLQRFEGEDQWLLIKVDDDEADARRNPTSTQPESVLSGRTLSQVDDEADQTGDDHRARGSDASDGGG